MKRTILLLLMMVCFALAAGAQTDRRELRAGNRKFNKGEFRESEIDYRKGLILDSNSVKAKYNLASALYRQGNYEAASSAISGISDDISDARVGFNAGDIALQKKDYAAAVKAFRSAMLLDPDDRAAKDNYTYAKIMLDNNSGGGGGSDNQNQNQDQNQNQEQEKNQEQNQEKNQNQNQNQNRNDGDKPQAGGNSPEQSMGNEQADRILRAIRAKEEETREKVNKEKALMMQSRKKEKNW